MRNVREKGAENIRYVLFQLYKFNKHDAMPSKQASTQTYKSCGWNCIENLLHRSESTCYKHRESC